MDSHQAALLGRIDPAVLGQRLRAARVAKGLTQTDLAGERISTGYVSRIESGQRRPNGRVLTDLAARMGVGLEELLGGVAPAEYDEIRLTLDFAELSLESGEAQEARDQASAALVRAEAASLDELAERAHHLHALALEGLGELDDAVLELESLVADDRATLLRIRAGIALTRCYRDSGDLSTAIDRGQRLLDQVMDAGLDACDEHVQLAVTLASAYFERGDTGHAVRICRTAVARAEQLGSPTARASAYWNTAIMESHRGDTAAAVPLAERALALLGEGKDTRNLARLRQQLGTMQLSLDPPAVDDARRNLEQAAREYEWARATPVDIAKNDLSLARARYLAGDAEGARELSVQVFEAVEVVAPHVAADAKYMEGQALTVLGEVGAADVAYRAAVSILTSIGADRSAAQLWFELASLFDELGDGEAARHAYRSAAASVGLRVRTSSTLSRTLV
ncbi:helix-turn-helix domain-containing protein [Nocardioides jensenii]|uniref:helix-turn-helix domain-containing protein n=1 Tax=Nocardioides jensenii TaxID=1843 RepID=UPI0008371C98|nr:helix-turn-helix domain-containing protein [Nocardioides jensenii]